MGIDPSIAIVDEQGKMSLLFRSFIQSLQLQAIRIGSGAPEGVLEASQGQLYMDEDGAAGAVLYIKQLPAISNDRTQGWLVI